MPPIYPSRARVRIKPEKRSIRHIRHGVPGAIGLSTGTGKCITVTYRTRDLGGIKTPTRGCLQVVSCVIA